MKRLSIILILLIGSILTTQAQHLAPVIRTLKASNWHVVSVSSEGQAYLEKKGSDSTMNYVTYNSHVDATHGEKISVFSSNINFINTVANELKVNKTKYLQLFPTSKDGKNNYYCIYWTDYFLPVNSLK